MHYSADSSVKFDLVEDLDKMDEIKTRIDNLDDELTEKRKFLFKNLIELTRYIYNHANKDIDIFKHLYFGFEMEGEHFTYRSKPEKCLVDINTKYMHYQKELSRYVIDNCEIVSEINQFDGNDKYLYFEVKYEYYDTEDDCSTYDNCGSYVIPVNWIELWVVGGISKLDSQLREKYEYMMVNKRATEEENKKLAEERRIQKEKEDKDKRYQEYLKLKEEFEE